MFANKPRKELALNAILIVALLFNAFVTAPVSAQGPEPTASSTTAATETPTNSPTTSPTSDESVTSTSSPTPNASGTLTPTPRLASTEPIPTADASLAPAVNFDQLPLSFVANLGQFDKKVKFQTNSLGGSFYFSSSDVTLVLVDKEVKSKVNDDDSTKLKDNSKVVQISYKNAENNPAVDGLNLLPGVANFMVGSDKKAWVANAPTYDGIIYHSLYPGIDLKYEGAGNSLKSTFIATEGADPSVIQWSYKYAGDINLDADGNLVVVLPAQKAEQTDNTLIEYAPVAWQEQNGQRVDVPVQFTIAADGQQIGFIFPQGYDTSLPLTIDPTLIFSTYLGGVGTDVGNAITTDSSGNVYVTGFSYCGAFPLLNPLPNSSPGTQEVIITKINASGNALRYSTCVGGTGDDAGLSIALDSQERIVVGGTTNSTNFPIVGGIATYGGTGGICTVDAPCQDAFLLALNAGGNAIRYSTYLGGIGKSIIDVCRGSWFRFGRCRNITL
jgi:beta-propeller repeat-containing protein